LQTQKRNAVTRCTERVPFIEYFCRKAGLFFLNILATQGANFAARKVFAQNSRNAKQIFLYGTAI
jgi:hypothetical protein